MSKCPLVLLGVRSGLSFQEEKDNHSISQATGVKNVHGRLCSEGLLLPLGVPRLPAGMLILSYSNEGEIWRVLTGTNVHWEGGCDLIKKQTNANQR